MLTTSLPDLRFAVHPAAHAYSALQRAIMRTDLEPGQRVSENELSVAFGISRTPLREAVSRLRDDRLLVVAPQRGTFVARIGAAAVADAQFIREALECAAIRRAVERVDAPGIARLRSGLDQQQAAVDAGDVDAFYELDDALHRSLCDLSGHPTVGRISDRAKVHLNRLRRLSLNQPDYLRSMVAEHRVVVDRLADRDADGAEIALRTHLRMVLREVPRIRAAHPGFFDDT